MRKPKYDRERLKFRRQFVLGPDFLNGFPTWKRLSVRPRICLTVHPDLPTHQARSGKLSITLLGFIVDPFRPEASDADIINRLLLRLDRGEAFHDLIRSIDALGGRWILIADDGRSMKLFNDPCGYRQVVYSRSGSRGVWCASQPGLLAELLDLAVDDEALAFIGTYRERNLQYWWPGDTSLYREIRHLLPNHYLNLETGTCHRYWPDRDLPARPLKEVIIENAQLLRRLIESASRRFGLALSITAGEDTRLLLAASRAILDQLYLFTDIFWELNWNSRDIRIPSALLSRLGLSHHVIRCPPRMDREFNRIYRRNVTSARDLYGSIAQGLYNHYPQGKVCMKGTANTITVVYYRDRLRGLRPGADTEEVDPHTLAILSGMEEEFAVKAYDRWLSEVNETNVDVLDLLLWEDREGKWKAMEHLEWDIVQEVFVPYDCRRYLVDALSIPGSHRTRPMADLQRGMILQLWPDVLGEPVNPPHRQGVISTARDLIEQAGEKVPWIRTVHDRYRYRWLVEFGEFRCGGLFYVGLHSPLYGLSRHLPR